MSQPCVDPAALVAAAVRAAVLAKAPRRTVSAVAAAAVSAAMRPSTVAAPATGSEEPKQNVRVDPGKTDTSLEALSTLLKETRNIQRRKRKRKRKQSASEAKEDLNSEGFSPRMAQFMDEWLTIKSPRSEQLSEKGESPKSQELRETAQLGEEALRPPTVVNFNMASGNTTPARSPAHSTIPTPPPELVADEFKGGAEEEVDRDRPEPTLEAFGQSMNAAERLVLPLPASQ